MPQQQPMHPPQHMPVPQPQPAMMPQQPTYGSTQPWAAPYQNPYGQMGAAVPTGADPGMCSVIDYVVVVCSKSSGLLYLFAETKLSNFSRRPKFGLRHN